MNIKLKALTKSLWVFHAAASPCNNCDIEILDVLTPRHDVERFGITLAGSVRHADVLLVTGVPNYKSKGILKRLYEQAPKPCLVIAIGSCACGRIMFRESYNSPCPVDEVIPVDAYVPGCPPKPEAIIAGVVKLIEKVKHTTSKV
ncbi:MAG: NADH-quinone oxidoreductase subunit NuoB [Candidatus Omnitrophota bacterium]|nr:NADH-quinone oxidoreductase subunit NuoB [Candidatus Omnitrophota bacterium]MBU1929292.1 NADH-quinone oxidoreductase subunit NuoB [Candidatus Omnitrophota bacterium]MBU2035584.1 NADH-quinone oxidoreductase subunit NuoB [Candidatus Omnitrophota bacterium]MBU2222160.1 NADH-quinone oxidoreductase subunit NuoB [Candidatus Omnitrophota bacterium]